MRLWRSIPAPRPPRATAGVLGLRTSHSGFGKLRLLCAQPSCSAEPGCISEADIGPREVDDGLGWIAGVPDVSNQRCICAGPYERRPSRKKQTIPLERLLPAQVLLDLETRLPCSTPTMVIITNLVPAKARGKHSDSQTTSCSDKPCVSALVGLFWSGGCNGVAAPPFSYARDLPMRGDQSSHSGKNNQ
jgi:hypothetical protein